MKIAICIVSYNRPDSVKRVLSSIERGFYNEDKVDLFISIDYSGDNAVQKVAEKFEWNHGDKCIISHKENLGLRRHILSCGDLVYDYDGLIVLEDDVFVAPSFYLYAKATIDKYRLDDRIAGISLYSFHLNYHNWLPFIPLSSDSDVYLMQNAQSWGQVWMPRQWKSFKEWYEQNSDDFPLMPHLPRSICSWKKSWLKYHTRYCIETNKYFIYPYISLSTCFSDTGEHTQFSSTLIQVPLCSPEKRTFVLNPTVCYDAFFENLGLLKVLGLKSKEVCIDLYGEKMNRTQCRYWLTPKIHNFKIIETYGLQMKPIELNVMTSIPGNTIFLYDTNESRINSGKYSELKYMEYIYDFNARLKKIYKLFLLCIQRYIKSKVC